MATHFRDGTAIDVVADACDAITAALESDPATGDLSKRWEAITKRADDLEAERKRLERAARRARARLFVQDAVWDGEVGAFGRAALDASGGKRYQAPYTRFFKDASPSEAQAFGVSRELKIGGLWLTELARDPAEPLAVKFTPRLGPATKGLDKASTDRIAAVRALEPHGTSVMLATDDVNLELDRLEGELKKRFPGDPKRVASYLSPTRPHRSEPDKDEGEPVAK